MTLNERILDLIGKLPVPQAMAITSIACILATATRYVLSKEHLLTNGTVSAYWEPSGSWLMFLLTLGGINTAHLLGKRMTDTDYAAIKAGRLSLTGDQIPPAPTPGS